MQEQGTYEEQLYIRGNASEKTLKLEKSVSIAFLYVSKSKSRPTFCIGVKHECCFS